MGEVVDILSRSPHLSGEAKCINCGHTYQADAPVGVFKDMKCPKCGTFKAVLVNGVMPEPTWVCNCGCWLFTVSGESGHILCWQCGAEQRFPDE